MKTKTITLTVEEWKLIEWAAMSYQDLVQTDDLNNATLALMRELIFAKEVE